MSDISVFAVGTSPENETLVLFLELDIIPTIVFEPVEVFSSIAKVMELRSPILKVREHRSIIGKTLAAFSPILKTKVARSIIAKIWGPR